MAAAERRGLVDLDAPFRLAGDPIVPERGFKPVRRDVQELLPPTLHRTARNLITARPRLVDPEACTKCHECETICGTQAIALSPLPVFDDHACVRCYACTEVCPTAAIDNVTPRVARILGARG